MVKQKTNKIILNKNETKENVFNIKNYPEEIQKSIRRGFEDIKKKQLFSNEEMKKKYSKWFPK